MYLIPIKLIISFFNENLTAGYGGQLAVVLSLPIFSQDKTIHRQNSRQNQVGFQKLLLLKMSALINIPTSRRDVYNTDRANVFSSNLCFKKSGYL